MVFSLSRIEEAIRTAGLAARGAFECQPADQVPAAADGTPAITLLLVGTIGSEFWPAFAASRTDLGRTADPLDAYSNRLISELAQTFNATALFPFTGPPWLPFQRWAQRADDVHPSPIGPLIHPQYGLWHAYRGALSFTRTLPGVTTEHPVSNNPCERCEDKPCLKTCPVGAFSGNRYDVSICSEHIHSSAGQPCMASGCLARLACPVGRRYRYQSEHAHFHMAAFAQARVR